jgi:UDP-N-acetylmuramoyl-tripeptide--D-alanyl-D-alanine ligase
MLEPLWTATELSKLFGQPLDCPPILKVAIDSRAVEANTLFIGIRGDNHDGGQYLSQAMANGAVAAIVHAPYARPDFPCLVVEDTTKAMETLGIAARARFGGKVIAITGSVGKTTTKETLRAALALYYTVHATEGNLNNHWGLPLTLANLPANREIAIVEMGMNHAGEILHLSRLARPHISIITHIAHNHIGNFDNGQLGIADAKLEILKGMEGDKKIFLPDQEWYGYLAAKSILAGVDPVRIRTECHDWIPANPGMTNCANGEAGLSSPRRRGSSQNKDVLAKKDSCSARNLLHPALTTAKAITLEIIRYLGKYQIDDNFWQNLAPPEGRGNIHHVVWQGKHLKLIDDSYNASPIGMKAALADLKKQATKRSVAVLGDMLEQGAHQERLHLSLIPHLTQIDKVFTVGEAMKILYGKLPSQQQGGWAPTALALQDCLKNALEDKDTILFKGSHGINLGQLVQLFTQI